MGVFPQDRITDDELIQLLLELGLDRGIKQIVERILDLLLGLGIVVKGTHMALLCSEHLNKNPSDQISSEDDLMAGAAYSDVQHSGNSSTAGAVANIVQINKHLVVGGAL